VSETAWAIPTAHHAPFRDLFMAMETLSACNLLETYFLGIL
jgi:hypothetical protein